MKLGCLALLHFPLSIRFGTTESIITRCEQGVSVDTKKFGIKLNDPFQKRTISLLKQ